MESRPRDEPARHFPVFSRDETVTDADLLEQAAQDFEHNANLW
jgi:hypothetical protein